MSFKSDDPIGRLLQEGSQEKKKSILTRSVEDTGFVSPFRRGLTSASAAASVSASASASRHRRFSNDSSDSDSDSRDAHNAASGGRSDSSRSDSSSDSDNEQKIAVNPFTNKPAYNKNAKQMKFPTVSATSALANQDPKELGFKTLDKSTKRAKDIKFPVYLTENEFRQQTILKELELKEGKLQYLKDSQKIIDLTIRQPDSDEEQQDEQDEQDDTEVEDNVDAENQQAHTKDNDTITDKEDMASQDAPEKEMSPREDSLPHPDAAETKIMQHKDIDAPKLQERKPTPDVDVAAEQAEEVAETDGDVDAKEVDAEAGAEADAEAKAADAVMDSEAEPESQEKMAPSVKDTSSALASEDLESYMTVETPQPYDKVPRIPYTEQPESGKKFSSFFKRNDNAGHPVITDVPVIPDQSQFDFPIATPENPELIAKTEEYGYMSKPIYDKVVYDETNHRRWLKGFKKSEKAKYDDKMEEYNNELEELQKEIDMINESMENLKKETADKIEVSENNLVKKIFERNTLHNEQKNKIFKETENIKNQKIQQKKEILDKHAVVQDEITQLNDRKKEVREEFDKWTTNMTTLGQQLDAKIMKVTQITMKQDETQKEIEKLETQKKEYQAQIDAAKKEHEEGQKVVESYENKEYLPKIHTIDNQISELLNELAIIKQENANEQTELSKITKELEEERRAHEEKLKLEAEERERQEKNLLEKQRLELEEKAEQQKREHEEQVRKMKEQYENELNNVKKQKESLKTEKLVEEHNRNENIKRKFLISNVNKQRLNMLLKLSLLLPMQQTICKITPCMNSRRKKKSCMFRLRIRSVVQFYFLYSMPLFYPFDFSFFSTFLLTKFWITILCFSTIHIASTRTKY